MPQLQGSKTEKNLQAAFAGESQARNKYTYFASAARKEGFEQIAAIFEETAGNEKEHAKLHFKALSGIGDTAANLKEAAGGLVDVYGQNDHVFLLHLESHLDYLDQYAETSGLRTETAAAAQDLRRLARQKAEWTAKERDRTQRLDFLRFQIAEIEKAGLHPGEEEELRGQRHILKNAEKISTLVDRALDLAYAGDASLTGLTSKLEHALTELGTYDAGFAELGVSLGPMGILVGEIADEARPPQAAPAP